MLFTGILFLLFASLLHSWYAENTKARRGTQSGAFIAFGTAIMLFAVLLGAVSAILIWVATSFIWLIVAVVAYFFIFPLIMVPFLRMVKTLPVTEIRKEEKVEVPVLDRDAFGTKLIALLILATKQGQEFQEINAGQLHRSVGGYPGPNHRMPICCSVMKSEMRDGDFVVEEPPNGQGASLTISYRLPRNDSNSDSVNQIFEEGREEVRRFFAGRNERMKAAEEGNG